MLQLKNNNTMTVKSEEVRERGEERKEWSEEEEEIRWILKQSACWECSVKREEQRRES